MPNVCIIDPDITELFFLKDSLLDTEFSIVVFHHDIFIDSVAAIDIIILSIVQDNSNGFIISKYLRTKNPSIKIVLTSRIDLCHYEEKILEHCHTLLLKPISKSEILCLLRTF